MRRPSRRLKLPSTKPGIRSMPPPPFSLKSTVSTKGWPKFQIPLSTSVAGSLSGEHGIGYEKKEYMGMVFTEADLDVMMRVKRVFNPDGLLNPSKIFPSRRGCTEIGPRTTTSTAEIGKHVEQILRGTAH